MKKILHILFLKFEISSLKRKRKNIILDISVKHPKRASRVDNLEDIRPLVFKEIDEKISSKERLIKVISK